MQAASEIVPTARRDLRFVALVGLLSGGFYAVSYAAQRAIYLNGLNEVVEGYLRIGRPQSMARLRWEAGAYYGATLVLFGLYSWLLLRVRGGRLQDRRARTLALLIPVVFNLALLFGRPYYSIDLHTYVAHSSMGATGDNPYAKPASDAIYSDIGSDLVEVGWNPVHGRSPYGPLWTQVEIMVGRITQDVTIARWLLKSLIVVASLVSAALIWAILGRVRPTEQLLGTLLYLWNPMILMEFAAEGHNDAVMIVFVLLGLWLAVRSQPGASIVAIVAGALAKYIPLVLLPAQMIYAWHTRRSVPRLLLDVGGGLLAGALLAWLLFRPLWIGPETLQGVREQGKQTFYASTPVTLYNYLLRSQDEEDASRTTSRVANVIFGLCVLVASLRVRDAGSLLRACGQCAMLFVLIASPTYWPWYIGMPLALMALSPQGSFLVMSVVLSFTSRLVAPIDDIANNGYSNWNVEVWVTTIVALLIPLAIYILVSIGLWIVGRQRRNDTRVQTA